MENWQTLEDLYKLHYEEIYRYLLRRVRKKEVAQDLAQDTFLKAFNGLSSFKGKSSVKTWLYTIAHHTFINWYRKETKYQYNDIDQSVPMEQSLYKSPEAVFDGKVRKEFVMAAIGELKEDFQHVLVLREFQELSYEEIAEVLDWKLAKVKTNLHRAKLELRKRLSRREGNIDEMLSD